MNYKISYLLKTPREISLEKAAEIIEVNTSEAIKQLTPFAEYVDDTRIRIKKFRAIDWAEKFWILLDLKLCIPNKSEEIFFI